MIKYYYCSVLPKGMSAVYSNLPVTTIPERHDDSRTSRVKVRYALHHAFDASVIPVFCKIH